MRTTSEKTAKQKMILAKAVLAAAERLGLTQDQLALILNIDSVKKLNHTVEYIISIIKFLMLNHITAEGSSTEIKTFL